MDALQRGVQMATTKMRDLPPLAISFARKLCSEVGGCGEVFITAFAVYAQIVEGLQCEDDLYKARPQDIAWFKEHGCLPDHTVK